MPLVQNAGEQHSPGRPAVIVVRGRNRAMAGLVRRFIAYGCHGLVGLSREYSVRVIAKTRRFVLFVGVCFACRSPKKVLRLEEADGMAANPRRRNRRVHVAILDATFDQLTSVGYFRMTIEGIAAQAGVGKATVYRWWPSK